MKVMDALSDVFYGREGLTDIPVPIISSDEAYRKENILQWVYFCAGHGNKWLNRLYDASLPKGRVTSWLFYKFKAEDFVHCGILSGTSWIKKKQGAPFTEGIV